MRTLFRSDHYLSVFGRGERGSLDAWATINALAATTINDFYLKYVRPDAEEARHETGFNRLSGLLGFEPVDDATFIDFRKIFPEDDLLRTATMRAASSRDSAPATQAAATSPWPWPTTASG